MQKFNFVTDGDKVYHLAGNDWYAVMQDKLAVMGKLGASKKRIKEILAYDFGLDYETVMGLQEVC